MSENNTSFDNDEDRFVELIDENGEHTVYEHLATIEYEGEHYLALCDPEEDEDEDEDLEVFILRIDQDENGNDVYNVPEDDVSDSVFEKLLEIIDDPDQKI